jgi:hypothetical protein
MDRDQLIATFLKKQKDHDDMEENTRNMRFKQRDLEKDFKKTEDHLMAL